MKYFAVVCVVGLSLAASAFAQSPLKSQVPGAYKLTSIYDVLADGKKNDTWGPEVKGSLILMPTGQFSVQIIGSNRDKTVAHTPREPVGPIVTYYGTYTVDEAAKTLTYHVIGSSFPRWEPIDRVAAVEATSNGLNIITTVKDDKQLGDLKAHQEWKRE
jgi:hypothetical protein